MADKPSAIKDHVTCSICIDLYKEPVVLPCMHSFCKLCLVGIHSAGKVLKCPECRKDTKLRKGGVESLPQNFHLGSIVHGYKKDHKPVMPELPLCTDHDLVCQLYCETCKEHLCVACISTRIHNRLHAITVMVDRNLSDVDGTRICSKHSREHVLICTYCWELACFECSLTTHKYHSMERLDLEYDSLVKSLYENTSDLGSKQKQLRGTQKSCRLMAQAIQNDSERIHHDVSLHFNRLRDELGKKEAAMKRELDDRETLTIELYMAHAKQASEKELYINDVINDVKRLLTENKYQMLKSYRESTIDVAEMLSDEDNLDNRPDIPGLNGTTFRVTSTLNEELFVYRWIWPEDNPTPINPQSDVPIRRAFRTKRQDNIQQPVSLRPGCAVRKGSKMARRDV